MDFHLIENEFLQSTVSPYGAELQSIFDRQRGTEYLWQGDPRYWAGRAPLLFPIVGRVRNGGYRYRRQAYSIESPHGFAKSLPFRTERQDSDSIRFVLEADRETLRQYPFRFRFAVEYVLDGRALRISFHVENRDDKIMPFSLGFHPGFRVPLENEPLEQNRNGCGVIGTGKAATNGSGELQTNSVNDLESHCLAFEENESPEQWMLDGVFLSGDRTPFRLDRDRFLPLSRSLFDDDAIILDGIRKKSLSLLGPDRRPRWTLHFDDFRFLALWQPARTEAPFLCLETWNGMPDMAGGESGPLTRKPFMRSLRPGNSYRASLRIVFE